MKRKEFQKITSLTKLGVPNKTILEALINAELSPQLNNLPDLRGTVSKLAQLIDNFYKEVKSGNTNN